MSSRRPTFCELTGLFAESVPHLHELTGSFAELNKITNTLLCTHICARTSMYVHSANSIQRNSISVTAYVRRSATVSKRKSSAHFIAMAEMVVHSAQILELQNLSVPKRPGLGQKPPGLHVI